MTRCRSTRGLLLVVIACAVTALPGDAAGQAAGTPLLYVGMRVGQFANVHNLKKPGNGPISHIFDGLGGTGPGVIRVDQAQNVYMEAGGTVWVYPRGGLVPKFRYDFLDLAQKVGSVGIRDFALNHDGTLYAIESLGINLPNQVAEYPPGDSNQASLIIPAPQAPCAPNTCLATDVAVDTGNNVYIELLALGTGSFASPSFIVKCPPGSTQCTDLGIKLTSGAGLGVDSQGDLITCEDTFVGKEIVAGTFKVFPPGSTQAQRVISLGLLSCGGFALNQDETRLYAANTDFLFDIQIGNLGVSVFDYATGALVDTITAGIPSGDRITGVAISPPARR